MKQKFALAVHGGAGTILAATMTPELKERYEDGLNQALAAGYECLESGGTAVEAVCAAVTSLEDNPLFNAGRGAVFNNAGTHEMDAAIMNGTTLEAGAVSGIAGVKNPVQLAYHIMQHSGHVMLSGTGAERYAKEAGLAFEAEAYFFTQQRYDQWREAVAEGTVTLDHTEKKMGTVGAVALDKQGHLAAATSTGGMTNKRFGRVGDSPIIGAGTYANNATCAVSCTGHGELFMRSVVAHDISCLMAYKGLSLQTATDVVVMDKLVKIGGEGGLIAIDPQGNVAMPFNSAGMYRGCRDSDGRWEVRIYRG